MRTNKALPILFAGLLLWGMATAATAQSGSQDTDAHHPAETRSGPPAATGTETPPAGMQGGMRGMGMMGGMQGEGRPESGMGQSMMMCPMMQMMGARPGMDMNTMMGTPMLGGMPHGKPEEMTPERVRALLEKRLEQDGNPRLKLGEIASAADGSITAEIVTVDGSLVQKLAFNRYPGLFRQLTE